MSEVTIWQQYFPLLVDESDDAILRLINEAQQVSLPANQTVFHSGSACENYLLVLNGSVRVQMLTEQGREVALYYVRSGQSCILTTSCLLGDQHYPVEGITETEVEALAISKASFEQALEHSSRFRKFVFDGFSQRLADVIARMEQVAFGSIDRRLATALLQGEDKTSVTHQALATEVGCAREVISRHLKRFESRGWLRLGRGNIELLDRPALENLLN